jgi:hypothetical protein
MFPLGCNAIPMMTLAPPVVGAGKPWPPFVPLPEAAAGVGPLWKGEAPREAGAERRRTLMARWSSLDSVKKRASSPHGSEPLVSPSRALDARGLLAPAMFY